MRRCTYTNKGATEMTHMGAYNMNKTAEGYTLTHGQTGEFAGTFPTARKAMDTAIALTAAAYKAKK